MRWLELNWLLRIKTNVYIKYSTRVNQRNFGMLRCFFRSEPLTGCSAHEGPQENCALNARLFPGSASKSFAIISPWNLFKDSSWRTKAWREAEAYCCLPSVLYGILEGHNLMALEKKPWIPKRVKQFNSKLEKFMACILLIINKIGSLLTFLKTYSKYE
jgi:hypothetical protein